MELEGATVHDAAGVPVGTVRALLGGPGEDGAHAAAVDVGDGRLVAVPLAAAEVGGGSIRVPHRRARIHEAPELDRDATALSAADAAVLAAHYREAGDEVTAATTELRPGRDEVEVVRSEEQLRVDRATVPHERVRVTKRIVEEEATVTVTLRREELVVEREPVADPDAVALPEGEDRVAEGALEFFLLAERPVVSTRVVPVERVRVGKDVAVEEAPVSATLRREEIDTQPEETDRT